MMKIAVLGGKFNPIHNGHLIVAQTLIDFLKFDSVLFVPSYEPVLRENTDLAPYDIRLEMVKCAVEANPKFKTEFYKGSPYTYNLMKHLKDITPDDTFSVIVGSDLVTELNMWKDIDKLVKEFEIVVIERLFCGTPFQLSNKTPYLQIYRPQTVTNMSSSAVRRYVKEGKDIRYLVPLCVQSIIKRKGLYK